MLRSKLIELKDQEYQKDMFISYILKYLEKGYLSETLLHELIDHIDVYEIQGVGKHLTQRISICYRFVGYIAVPMDPESIQENAIHTQNMRQGVAVNYIPVRDRTSWIVPPAV